MDSTQASLIAITILTPLAPYLVKAGEALAQEVGKAVFAQAKTLYTTIRRKFEQTDDVQAKITLEMLDKASDAEKQQLVEAIVQQAQSDVTFDQVLTAQVDDLNALLFECLQKKFLIRDLKQVYFRLGIGWDDLIGEMAGRDVKVMELINHVQTRERIPDLIKAMWAVYPGLRC